MKHPPLTLEELRDERIKKERRARQDRDAFKLLRKGSGVTWDEGFRGIFSRWSPETTTSQTSEFASSESS